MEAFKSNMPKFFAEHELKDFDDWLEKQPDRKTIGGNEEYFVVELDGHIIACGGYYYDENSNETRMTWGLVKSDLHHQGIGKTFLEYRIKAVRNQFPESVIALDTTQHSYPFFEKLGFKTTKVTDNYYAPELHRYDMVLEDN
jgi:N-acetylglutamate synthase-like GNAT family acetyltransferase